MENKNVLVVGGAGYIGAHTCRVLYERGFLPIVLDNLSSGHAEFVLWGPLEQVDICDYTNLRAVFAKYQPASVMHFAGLTNISESVKNPSLFYEINIKGSFNLIATAIESNVRRFIFSSTCATYGIPHNTIITENDPQESITPYGYTKYVVERELLQHNKVNGLRSVVLRYFNAAGATLDSIIGEWHNPETHVIPLAIKTAMGYQNSFKVFGQDYATRDGTCLRDYIHVLDLANAHIMALEYLINQGDSIAINLGTGTGITVKEIISTIQSMYECAFPITYESRRIGDPPSLVADNKKAKKILGWNPKYKLRDIIESAWNWHLKYPRSLSNEHE
ncbi:UDP-glucose 4-epimerase GalE [Candidatus Liberibacter asiaticus]|uniref:UDP-glucose 4-epimerase n=2 Tax=Liberibacter asiaticus TaxID=34021 RepID=C6XHQ8_LIBAP|nr:UDP-glucose 4-epimerase GalE [Candidatus Liberibacter asiaticus]ACT56801.1 UDP-glucose 4-epimerase [Candidatus Liberibacter asiaticus str. psy62]AGH16568.1 UDP-glucose 4-epimerase [Candidatus Liberibacter asiaticus str. gxpsy]ALK06959.1 UDP-glucose 4-epimerase GalE [Candidatus Liberibacter asiaticus]ASK52429.1 UDP-glucose 4-epimerase GalE [Candidatus Liberibacter asiaticus]AWL13756.1 UDP-glucose 4-epimerase GalE [Candidatus Liberibacter asiaticus]